MCESEGEYSDDETSQLILVTVDRVLHNIASNLVVISHASLSIYVRLCHFCLYFVLEGISVFQFVEEKFINN